MSKEAKSFVGLLLLDALVVAFLVLWVQSIEGQERSQVKMEPVLVEFTATWCNECRRIDPQVKSLKRQGFKIVQADIDDQKNLALQHFYCDKVKIPQDSRTVPMFFIVSGTKLQRIPLTDLPNLAQKFGMAPTVSVR